MDAPIPLEFKYSWGREGRNRAGGLAVSVAASAASKQPGTLGRFGGPLQAPSAARASPWTPAAARWGLLGRGWIRPPWQAAISGWSRSTPGAARRDAAATVRRRQRVGGTLPVAILDTRSGGGQGCPRASGSPPAPKPGGLVTHRALCPPVGRSGTAGAAWVPQGAGAGLVGPPRDPAAWQRGVLHPFPRRTLPRRVGKNGPVGLCHLNFMVLWGTVHPHGAALGVTAVTWPVPPASVTGLDTSPAFPPPPNS